MDQHLGGRLVEDSDMFTAYAANITPGGVIADWTDAELGRAIREGIRPDGTVIGPLMPFGFYRNISDTDLAAIVTYLRSVPVVDLVQPASVWNIPLPPAYGPPLDAVADLPRGVTVEWGEYVAQVSHCMECHSGWGPTGPMIDTHLGAGGFEFHGPWGVSIAPNITNGPDGLLAYTDAEIADMIIAGQRPDGSAMLPPMPYPYLARMTPEDLDALILYLRSVPPLPDAG
ncbi:cytochrome C [Pseudoruegeria sp. SK021]|nr:cytochrome C [Pseudoruegeria sp. SK021]